MNKFKVLHIFDNYLPQTENWAFNLISSLSNAEIHIGAKNYLKNDFYNNEFHFIDNYFDEFDKMNRRLSKRNLIDVFKKVFIKTIPFIFGSVEQLFINYSRKHNIQLVHIHFANIGWEFHRVSQKLKVPLIISFYGWDYEKLPFVKPEYQERFQMLFKIADGFICEGNHGAAILEGYGCPKEKIFVVRLGIQASKVSVVERVKAPNKLKLVQLASFTEKKGHRYAIEAVARIANDCPNLELTFIGNDRDPDLRNNLRKLKDGFNLKNRIQFKPAIGYKELFATLTKYDVFIHPSCYAEDRDCEGGAPVVLLDAQATGMPVISTTHCDIPDEVIHGKTGLLSPEKKVDLLSDNIKTFYEMDNMTYQNYVRHARKHVEENYDINNNAKELQKVYNKFIDSN